MIQRHEIEAWLGDNHGLTDDQITELMRTADDIEERHPDPDDHEEREAALTTAYRIMAGDECVVEELAAARVAARVAEVRSLAGLRQAAHTLIESHQESEAGYARRAGVDRMAVRDWLGKR